MPRHANREWLGPVCECDPHGQHRKPERQSALVLSRSGPQHPEQSAVVAGLLEQLVGSETLASIRDERAQGLAVGLLESCERLFDLARVFVAKDGPFEPGEARPEISSLVEPLVVPVHEQAVRLPARI